MSNQTEFWKFPSISEEHFLKQVDTGDLLLFRTNNNRIVGSWITRAYTKSHFDHVGMILRFGDSLNQLFIFEAVGDTGVRIIGWNSLRRELFTNGFFEKICTRKLNYDMTNERLGEARREDNLHEEWELYASVLAEDGFDGDEGGPISEA